MAKLFSEIKIGKLFKWNDGVRTIALRTQYNELLQQVIIKDAAFLSDLTPVTPAIPYQTATKDVPPNYYNGNFCLTLNKCIPSDSSVDIRTSEAEIKKSVKESARPNTLEAKSDESKALSEKNDNDINNLLMNISINQPRQTNCFDNFNEIGQLLTIPRFHYRRMSGNPTKKEVIDILNSDGTVKEPLDAKLVLENQLPCGSVIWLYFYERMGIFKILGALMDDYNYRGKLPISSKSQNNTPDATLQYSELMDTICTLYRMGVGSNLRDRITLYQRVLGVSIENNLNIDSEKNDNFMRHFNKLVSYSIDFYQNKQLAQAIRDTNNNAFRSSVATQTAIRDTILVLQKNFEVFEYGRNRLNTFIGIATVYATICLLRMLKDEIGIPRQYNEPDEFIPAAYDILVLKRPTTSSETNRFTIYDNCASFGFRLLTDIELIEANQLTTISIGSPLDAWLNDVEGTVEGYNNAFKSILEPASAMV